MMVRSQRLKMRQPDDVVKVLMRQKQMNEFIHLLDTFTLLFQDVRAKRTNARPRVKNDARAIGWLNLHTRCVPAVTQRVRPRTGQGTASPPTPKAESGGVDRHV